LQAEDSRADGLGPTRADRANHGFGLSALSAPTLREGTTRADKTVEDAVLIIEVEGTPQPEPRARFDPRSLRTYVPSSAHDWKREIRKRVRVEMLRAGLVSVIPIRARAFAVGFMFRFARPKSHYRTGRFAGLLKEAAPRCHLGKPDLDNLVKAAVDALGHWDGRPALVWADDSQITRYVGTPTKRYCEPGEVAGLTLVVWAC